MTLTNLQNLHSIMARNGSIRHEAVITAVEDGVVRLRIVSKSACSECHAKGMCGLADMKEKVVEVKDSGQSGFKVGDKVFLSMDNSTGFNAVLISYVVPLIILLILLLSLPMFLGNELSVGVGIIIALALYYVVVYLFRNRIGRHFVFRIEK